VTREHTLRRQIDSLHMLGDAVNAMKALSAHHLRAARAGLATARSYRNGIDTLLEAVGIAQILPSTHRPGLLVLASDLGLCGGYNSRLTDISVKECHRLDVQVLYLVGRRPLVALRRAGMPVTRTYPTISSAAGLLSLLLTLADDVLSDYLSGAFSTLHVVSARFDGVGAFSPTSTPLLPVTPTRAGVQSVTAPYASVEHLTRIAIREYLYSTLYELVLDALASEHGARLVATQAAGQWLDGRLETLRRQLSSAGRESSTQEVLDVAAGARQRRRTHERDLGAADTACAVMQPAR
jgi:F-type H+-transporting ATPase subunit gamma